MTSKAFLNDHLFNLLISIFIVVLVTVLYCVHCTVYTQAHSVHRNIGVEALQTHWEGGWGTRGTITRVFSY